MKYVNANTLLPAVLVEELQGYIQGGYIYVPVRQDQPKHWGELSGYREELENETGKLYAPLRQGILWNTLLKSIICLSTQFVRLFISSIEGGAEMRPPVLYKTLPNHSVY